MNKLNDNKKNLKPIEVKESKLEKTLKLSNNETLAMAIRELLVRDKIK